MLGATMGKRVAIALFTMSFMLSPDHVAAAWPYVQVHAGWSWYEMNSVNDQIRAVNDITTPDNLREIDYGPLYGAGLGLELGDRLGLSVEYDRLLGSAEKAHGSETLSYDTAANVFRVTGRYDVKREEDGGLFLGASFGQVSETGSVALSAAGSEFPSGDLSGSALMFELLYGAHQNFGPQVEMMLELGYRNALVTNVKVNGEPLLNEQAGNVSIDHGGLVIRVGWRLGTAR